MQRTERGPQLADRQPRVTDSSASSDCVNTERGPQLADRQPRVTDSSASSDCVNTERGPQLADRQPRVTDSSASSDCVNTERGPQLADRQPRVTDSSASSDCVNRRVNQNKAAEAWELAALSLAVKIVVPAQISFESLVVCFLYTAELKGTKQVIRLY